MSSGNYAQVISVAKVQHADLGLANACGIRENGIETGASSPGEELMTFNTSEVGSRAGTPHRVRG